MILKSPDGSIEISVLVFSNNILYGFPSGELRKKKIKPNEHKKPRKKDPEENLGNVIATIDIEKIEHSVDFSCINDMMERMLKRKNITINELFSDEEDLPNICKAFEMSVEDFVTLMVEKRPMDFNIPFLRSVVKPFIMRVKDEKFQYENETELNPGYKPIFDLL